MNYHRMRATYVPEPDCTWDCVGEDLALGKGEGLVLPTLEQSVVPIPGGSKVEWGARGLGDPPLNAR